MNNETVKKLDSILKNPDRRHAIYPIIHHRIATEPEQLDWIDKNWFAGIVGNVPYNENFPNDQNDWQKTFDGFKNCINRGMFTWIYDEKGYPSGTAGGTVTEMNPEFVAEGLYCYEYWRTLTGPCYYRADVLGDKLYRAMLLPLDGGEAIDVTHFATKSGTLKMQVPAGNYHLFMMCSRRLFDGTHAAESYSEPRNYISLSDKEATEAFIKVTHEKYAEQLSGEFGKGVRAFFTDEPSLIAWGIKQQSYPIVPWHHTYPELFRKKYNYPIEYAITAVVTKRGPDVIKRRCDFWEFIAETVAENYFGTIQEWCKKHGLKSSGHFLHEEKLQSHIYNYGSMYKSGKRMDWPGIDLLTNEPQDLMNTVNIPIARLLASFADISGEKETFTEFSDMTSRFLERLISLDWVMAAVNWHHALGINNFTSYHIWNRFKEQDFTDLNKYTARIGGIMRLGKRDSRTAVLYPDASLWAAYTPSTAANAIDNSPETLHLSNTFAKTSWELLHRQIDFDYIDEDLILDGEIKDGKLCYNDRTYECIVLPVAKVLRRSTIEKLVELLKNRIGVIAVGELPSIARESGKKENFDDLFAPFMKGNLLKVVPAAEGWSLSDVDDLPLPDYVTVYPQTLESVMSGADNSVSYSNGKIISRNILSHTRLLEDGTKLVFLCNMGGDVYHGSLRAAGGTSVKKINPVTTEITDEAGICKDDAVIVNIELKAYEAFIWIVK